MLLTIILLFACSSNLQGEWNGACIFKDQNDEQSMNVTAKIQRDNGYSLEGSLWLEHWDDIEFEGDLSGDHNGKYVLLRSSITSDFGPYQFKVDAEKIGVDLEGDCLVQSPESVGSLIGSIYLRK